MELRNWQPTPQRPSPDIGVLEQALVWNSEKYSGLREGLIRRAAAPVEVPSTNASLRILDFPHRRFQGHGAPQHTLARAYVYKSTGTTGIPSDALACPIRAVVVACTARDDPNIHPTGHVLRSYGQAVTLLYGPPATVRALAVDLEQMGRKNVRKDVDVWVQGDVGTIAFGGERSRLYRRLMVLLCGPNDLDLTRVCPRTSPPPQVLCGGSRPRFPSLCSYAVPQYWSSV